MFLRGICLRELNQSTVTCSGLASLETALKLLSENHGDRIVVIDSQQHPLGLLKLERLLPSWCVEQAELRRAPAASNPGISNDLKTAIQAISPSLIESIPCVSADWSIQQFLFHLEEPPQPTYALVDAQGQYLGLLDCSSLLQQVAKHSSAGNMPAREDLPFSRLNNSQWAKQQTLAITQQLIAQKTSLEQQLKLCQEQLKSQQEEIEALRRTRAFPGVQLLGASGTDNASCLSSHITLLHALLHLIERLPFPLMLQTNKGQVIAQNSVWQRQVGELSDPLKLWREASIYLDAQTPSLGLEAHSQFPLTSFNGATSPKSLETSYAQSVELPGTEPFEQPLCQSGVTADSCVCVCPLKDGQEQVLQFVKIPLGTLLPNLQFDWATMAPLRENSKSFQASLSAATGSSSDTDFHLATLTSPSDAASSDAETPDNLSQTEIESLWLILAQDVTKQQDLAKELTAQNADLVQLNRLKDEFLACISHELKTPLTAVLGLSTLLKDQTLGELNQKQVHYAQLIYQSSRHLMGVVNDILDLTRIETGQFDLLFDLIDIPTVCSSAFEKAKQIRLAESKTSDIKEEQFSAQFSLEIEPGLTTLVADELRLKQMLAHLLANSLKFTESAKPIGLKVNRWGGWIAFTVWDTGIGIPADKQHLIFQKFQQLENPLTRQFEGAGLGLVLTHRLARLHGGDVTFISKEGQGSQFTILLPPSPPNKTQLNRGDWLEEEPDNRRSAYSRNSVLSLTNRIPLESTPQGSNLLASSDRTRLTLIVEAVPQFVETLTHQLSGLGYRVVIARSGTEALEKARRIQPCIIFLDPFLPLLSGWDVLTLLKSNPETQHIPVVITASGIDGEQAQKNQANGVLKVPIQKKDLKRLLEQFNLDVKEPDAPWISSRFTILRLLPKENSDLSSLSSSSQLNYLLQAHQHRVLECDDLEQAELLVKIWKPNAVLLGSSSDDPTTYVKRLGACPALASLPLITLDQSTTQAANQIPGLFVFPCLLSENALAEQNSPELAKLLQVLQVAIESIWKSSVLAIDLSTLQMADQVGNRLQEPNDVLGTFPKETEWLEALMQYLQTAGLRGRIGRSWHDVVQQMELRNVDLLLLCWTGGEPSPQVLEMLLIFNHLSFKPPIIVLDHRDPELGNETVIPLPDPVRKIATRIFSPTVSMAELLEQIEQVMHQE